MYVNIQNVNCKGFKMCKVIGINTKFKQGEYLLYFLVNALKDSVRGLGLEGFCSLLFI